MAWAHTTRVEHEENMGTMYRLNLEQRIINKGS